MGASERRQLPADLVQGQSRFQRWRGQRKPGGRIPESLWALAVRLAEAHGVSRTAAALGLDYYSLQKRIGADDTRSDTNSTQSNANEPAFIEWPSSLMVGKRCQIEFENGAGATMRVQLVGYDAAEVEALSRSLWNAL